MNVVYIFICFSVYLLFIVRVDLRFEEGHCIYLKFCSFFFFLSFFISLSLSIISCFYTVTNNLSSCRFMCLQRKFIFSVQSFFILRLRTLIRKSKELLGEKKFKACKLHRTLKHKKIMYKFGSQSSKVMQTLCLWSLNPLLVQPRVTNQINHSEFINNCCLLLNVYWLFCV